MAAGAVVLRTLKPLFERHPGDQLLDSPWFVPALGIYLFYVAGVVAG